MDVELHSIRTIHHLLFIVYHSSSPIIHHYQYSITIKYLSLCSLHKVDFSFRNSSPLGKYDDTAGYYDDTAGYYDDAAGYYDDTAGYYDDTAGYYDDTGGYYDDTAGYYDDTGEKL